MNQNQLSPTVVERALESEAVWASVERYLKSARTPNDQKVLFNKIESILEDHELQSEHPLDSSELEEIRYE